MKILITGVNGFVGYYLKKKLEGKNHQIFGLDIQSNADNILAVELTRYEEVRDALFKIEPDIIYHLAAVSQVDFRDPRMLYDVNFNGTLNLLTASIQLKKKPRFIFISSSQVYGIVPQEQQPISEDFPIRPVNHYGASKAAGESLCMAFRSDYGLPLVIVRPFNHTGRRQTTKFLIGKLVKAYREKEKNLSVGNMDIIRDFMDVRDVAEAYSLLAENFQDGKVFNVASGQPVSFREVIKKLEKLTGHFIEIQESESLLRKNDIEYALGDASKLKETLGWKPRFSFEETLEWMLLGDE